MAKMTLDDGALDDLIKGLEELGADADEIAKDCIDAASPVLTETWRSNVRAAANRGYATGALANSIEATRAKTNAYGNFAAVRPTGTRPGRKRGRKRKGQTEVLRYGEQMAYLEYGRAGRKGNPKAGIRAVPPQAPRPTLARSIAQAEGPVIDIITKKFEEHVDRRIKP